MVAWQVSKSQQGTRRRLRQHKHQLRSVYHVSNLGKLQTNVSDHSNLECLELAVVQTPVKLVIE